DPELTRLVKQLGDDAFGVREEATKKLQAQGEKALEALYAASESPDLEIASRARRLIRLIEKSVNWEVRQFKGHTDQILSVAFDKSGKRCASGGFDKTIRV